MNYPDWAPKSLVELYKRKSDPDSIAKAYKGGDPESIIADILQKSEVPISEENVENLRRQIYRSMIIGGLPDNEEIVLLEKLITDKNMKSVWASLSKRFKDEQKDPHDFFMVCQRGITGWRGDQKQTPAERKVFYQEIYDSASKLQSLMNTASEFDHYSIGRIINSKSIEWIIENLGISDTSYKGRDSKDSYTYFCMSEIIPSIHEVLNDIGEKAAKARDANIPVKKPNSENAGVHYFIRLLSVYCQGTYGQPLHEVVAITTSVIFDLPNCDDDYVRKIVKA